MQGTLTQAIEYYGVAMVTVNIDLPIFCSPTKALGHFSGPVQLRCMPALGRPFPWPEVWTRQFSEIFDRQATQVWGISDWPYSPESMSVTMYGLVCNDCAQARELANHLERCTGILFSEHEH